MGALNIIIGGFILIIFLLVFMQPVIMLVDTAKTMIEGNNPVKQGTNSEGVVEDVGQSVFAPDLVIALLFCIGLAFFVGFLIWAGKGGRDPYEDAIQQGGFQR